MPRRSSSWRISGPGSVELQQEVRGASVPRRRPDWDARPAARAFRRITGCAQACGTNRTRATGSALKIFMCEALIYLFGRPRHPRSQNAKFLALGENLRALPRTY